MLLKVDNSQSGRLASLAASTDSLYLSKTAYIVLKGVVDKVAGHFNIRLVSSENREDLPRVVSTGLCTPSCILTRFSVQ